MDLPGLFQGAKISSNVPIDRLTIQNLAKDLNDLSMHAEHSTPTTKCTY